MIPFPTSFAEARGAFAAIKAVTDAFGPLKDHERINPSQAVYANRSGGEPGAMLCNRDSNGQADWHMTIWFDSGDFELWNDAGSPQGRLTSSGNVHTGELKGQIARKAA